MESYPLVYILITTYNRTPLAVQTIRGLKLNLRYPNIAWHIADDGSDMIHETESGETVDHITALKNEIFRDRIGNEYVVTVTNSLRQGVGKSKNMALKHIFSVTPYVLMLEDDWYLDNPLDIIPHVDMLSKHEDVGMVRYGFLGGGMNASYEDFNGLPYWRLARGSGVYIYSGQVSLRHQRFYDAVGFHEEGVSPGEEELEMCKRFNGTELAPDILWPGNIPASWGPFRNIGMTESLNAMKPGGQA